MNEPTVVELWGGRSDGEQVTVPADVTSYYVRDHVVRPGHLARDLCPVRYQDSGELNSVGVRVFRLSRVETVT